MTLLQERPHHCCFKGKAKTKQRSAWAQARRDLSRVLERGATQATTASDKAEMRISRAQLAGFLMEKLMSQQSSRSWCHLASSFLLQVKIQSVLYSAFQASQEVAAIVLEQLTTSHIIFKMLCGFIKGEPTEFHVHFCIMRVNTRSFIHLYNFTWYSPFQHGVLPCRSIAICLSTYLAKWTKYILFLK